METANEVRQSILPNDWAFSLDLTDAYLISSLGLIINEKKSDLIPVQNCVFIGMEFLTHKNIVRVSWDRVQDILNLVLWFKISKDAKIRNRYNQVPHLTQDTNGKVTNTSYTPQRVKRSALSQQLTTRQK